MEPDSSLPYSQEPHEPSPCLQI